MSVINLNAQGFLDVVKNSDIPVVVDFYADWCGPCHQLAPIIDSLSRRYEGRAVFARVNVDDEPELAAKYQIQSIPAVILFDGGEPRARSIGAKPPRALVSDLGLDEGGEPPGRSSGEKKVGAVRGWWGRR
jgi:thioredoxin